MKALLPISLLLALCWTAPLVSQQAPPPAASPALTESLHRAFELLGEGKFQMAKTELEKATKLAGGPCGACLLGMAHVYASEGAKWAQVAETVQQALPLLTSPDLQAQAYDQLGVAYVKLNEPDSLKKAEEAFRHGAEFGGSWGAIAIYNLAEILYRQQKWAEAVEAGRRYVKEAGAEGTELNESRALICRARARLTTDLPPEVEGGKDTEPKKVEGDVKRPEYISMVRPVYTDEARKNRVAGKVVLESVIDEEGCVRHLKPLQELPDGLTEAAMNAVRQWVFFPATVAGKPIKVYYVLTVNFQLEANEKPQAPPPGKPPAR